MHLLEGKLQNLCLNVEMAMNRTSRTAEHVAYVFPQEDT
jgi:hypothetical protein